MEEAVGRDRTSGSWRKITVKDEEQILPSRSEASLYKWTNPRGVARWQARYPNHGAKQGECKFFWTSKTDPGGSMWEALEPDFHRFLDLAGCCRRPCYPCRLAIGVDTKIRTWPELASSIFLWLGPRWCQNGPRIFALSICVTCAQTWQAVGYSMLFMFRPRCS